MITWVTVWVLTVSYINIGGHSGGASHYQLQYATQETCLKQKQVHLKQGVDSARCDFQQIPVVVK